ncbi:MAG: DUF2752 domain-containing protein [Fimbriimonas sp.]
MTLFEPARDRKQISGQLIWFLVWVGVTGVAAFLTPNASGHGTHQALGMPPCPSVLLFDRPCPGCGLTTSWTAFVHGNFALSFRAHALGPATYLLFTLGAWACLYGWIKNWRFGSDEKWAHRSVSVAVAVFLAFGLIRMAVSPGFAMPEERWMTQLINSK